MRALARCLPAARTRAAGGAGARFGVRPALDRREAMQQLDRIDGLGEMTVEPRCLGARPVRLPRPAGQRDQVRPPGHAVEAPGDLVAAAPRLLAPVTAFRAPP